jgi:hypothetical protein
LEESGDPRAQLIRAREAFRNSAQDRRVVDQFLQAVIEYVVTTNERLKRKRKWRPIELMGELYGQLDERGMRAFETDCAERVLPIFEAAQPGDRRPREAIQASRAFLAGSITPQELHATIGPANDAREAIGEPAWSAAGAAANAASWGLPYGCSAACEDAASAIADASGNELAWEAEHCWQIGRIVDLLLYGWDYPLPKADQDAIRRLLQRCT